MHKKIIDPNPGLRLAEIRMHLKMSQQQVATAIGVSLGTIQHYEHGRAAITVDRIKQLANALNCEPAILLEPPGAPLPPISTFLIASWQRSSPGHVVAFFSSRRSMREAPTQRAGPEPPS